MNVPLGCVCGGFFEVLLFILGGGATYAFTSIYNWVRSKGGCNKHCKTHCPKDTQSINMLKGGQGQTPPVNFVKPPPPPAPPYYN